MSANNTFNLNRFLLLFRQHLIHNGRIMIYSIIGYCGVVFIVLSLVQFGEDLQPFDAESFTGFLLAFVAIFGILFVGHAFPAFRSRENSINYLMLPASLLEKYLFELIYRVGSILIILPVMFWITFHIQGYFFQLFIDEQFYPVIFSDILNMKPHAMDEFPLVVTMITAMSILALLLAFTGAAHFSKNPLVKTLFSVALIIAIYFGFAYMIFDHLGLERYRPNDSLWLIPRGDKSALRFFSIAIMLANLVMLLVAFLKLKEKEV